jgi:hypothetical protein
LDGQAILSQNVYSAVVLMVVITTVITPVGLRWVFGAHQRLRGENDEVADR